MTTQTKTTIEVSEYRKLIVQGRSLFSTIKRDQRSALLKAYELGRLLLRIKDGTSGKILEATKLIGVNYTQGGRFMRMARLPAKTVRACKTLTEALRLVGVRRPKEQPGTGTIAPHKAYESAMAQVNRSSDRVKTALLVMRTCADISSRAMGSAARETKETP